MMEIEKEEYYFEKCEIPIISEVGDRTYGYIHAMVYKDEILFVGVDLGRILQYKRPNDAIRQHVSRKDRVMLDLIKINVVNAPEYWKSLNKLTFLKEACVFELIVRSKMRIGEELAKIITHKSAS